MRKYLAELAKNVGNPLGADFFQRLGGASNFFNINGKRGFYMRRIVLALASALSVGVLQSASAADIPAPVYKAPPAAVVVRNWTGCYIGGNGGYGWAPKDFSDVASGASLGSHTAEGGVAPAVKLAATIRPALGCSAFAGCSTGRT